MKKLLLKRVEWKWMGTRYTFNRAAVWMVLVPILLIQIVQRLLGL
jgi:hypothetical protein